MNEDKRITQKDVDEAQVRLKPILGIEPGRYLTVLYGLALAAALFALLVLPGIRHNGAEYTFRVDPPDAAVFIDGVYRVSGSSPIFLASGAHLALVKRQGFVDKILELDVEGRLFGSLFFPARRAMPVRLISNVPISVLMSGFVDYSAWSLAGTPSDAYQLPMPLSASALAWTALNADRRETVPSGYLGAALSYAASAASARDALRARAVVSGESAALTPATMGRMVAAALEDIASEPSILVALLPWLPADARSRLEASPFYGKASAPAAPPPAPRVDRRLTAAGIDFIMLRGGSYALGQARGVLPSFGMAVSETTVAEFARFLAENPGWDLPTKDLLIAGGQADKNYLTGFGTASGGEPVRYVSREAAMAYCRWLSRLAPEGYRFALPTESQWAYAAAASLPRTGVLLEPGRLGPVPVGALVPDTAGFRGLLGNVWEWCADSYSIFPAVGAAGRVSFPSAEGVVRGGSWANQPGSVDLSSRGPMATSATSAFLGFRIALVPLSD